MHVTANTCMSYVSACGIMVHARCMQVMLFQHASSIPYFYYFITHTNITIIWFSMGQQQLLSELRFILCQRLLISTPVVRVASAHLKHKAYYWYSGSQRYYWEQASTLLLRASINTTTETDHQRYYWDRASTLYYWDWPSMLLLRLTVNTTTESKRQHYYWDWLSTLLLRPSVNTILLRPTVNATTETDRQRYDWEQASTLLLRPNVNAT